MTETTQPDPQVVVWMRNYRRKHPDATLPSAIDAYEADDDEALPTVSHATFDRLWTEAAREPLTVADIPAGQGPASLYLAPTERGIPGLWYRGSADHESRFITDQALAHEALWDHLAATLPTVTTEDAP